MDPIGAFDIIRDNFILYVKTAFGTRFKSVEKDREELLRSPRVMSQEPWIEPLPRYQRSGKTFRDLAASDLPGLNSREINDFKEIVACGLLGDFRLYTHQTEMLKKALEGRNCVVTAGTGSGKTEAFLLPLFAYIARESAKWEPPSDSHPHLNDWWKNEEWKASCKGASNELQRSWRVSQREHEGREAAVRALIIYPMNALVEDQLTRLRKALDSSRAREWFKHSRNGNKIYFGRYNSNTPVPGQELDKPTNKGKRSPI